METITHTHFCVEDTAQLSVFVNWEEHVCTLESPRSLGGFLESITSGCFGTSIWHVGVVWMRCSLSRYDRVLVFRTCKILCNEAGPLLVLRMSKVRRDQYRFSSWFSSSGQRCVKLVRNANTSARFRDWNANCFDHGQFPRNFILLPFMSTATTREMTVQCD